MLLIDTPEAANRLARAIMSDIRIYNEEKVRSGIMKDTLFNLLAEDLEEGRRLYRSRVSEELRVKSNFYGRAIVDVLIYRSRGIPSKIW